MAQNCCDRKKSHFEVQTPKWLKTKGKNIWAILGFECISSHVILSLSQQFWAILGYTSYWNFLSVRNEKIFEQKYFLCLGSVASGFIQKRTPRAKSSSETTYRLSEFWKNLYQGLTDTVGNMKLKRLPWDVLLIERFLYLVKSSRSVSQVSELVLLIHRKFLFDINESLFHFFFPENLNVLEKMKIGENWKIIASYILFIYLLEMEELQQINWSCIEITKTKNVSDDAMISGASNPFTFVTKYFWASTFLCGCLTVLLTKNVFKKRSLCCFASPQVRLLPRRRRCSARPTCTWRTGR